jgi:photosystem II stability/assembly factor-like uncharacterized protein
VRRIAAGAILGVLAAAAGLSSRQPTPAAYARLPRIFSPAWWLKPIELNSGLRPDGADLHNVFFASPRAGWAIGYCGTILATTDGGGNWHRQESGTKVQLWAMHFFNNRQGLVMGDNGVALRTENGGVTWTPVNVAGSSATQANPASQVNAPYTAKTERPAPRGSLDLPGSSCKTPLPTNTTAPNLISLSFADPTHGWVAGSNGAIYATADGGQTWTPQTSGTTQAFRSISFPTDQLGWAVGNAETIERTSDGGKTWTTHPVTLPAWFPSIAFYSVIFPTPDNGWIVGASGTVLHTRDGGATWSMGTPPIGGFLTDAVLVPPNSLWVTGSSQQALFYSQDGGKTWTDHSGKQSLWLRAVAFPNAKHGWAVGSNETVLHTADGGSTWSLQTYTRLPAPWFFALAALSLPALLVVTRPVRPRQTQEYIESLGAADSPVETLRNDALGYGPLVSRLARFIQNPRTTPPLVMAVQAPWGMGKSSVMSMLRSELRAKRSAVCVWFNAWHHQKEDELLAYLMDAVQRQVAPSWFSAVGLRFRFNLLRVRMFSSPERFLLTVAAVACLPMAVAFGSGWEKVLPWLAGGGLVAMNLLRSFSADPQKLLKEAPRSIWKSAVDLVAFPTLQGKTDVRFQFMKELKEVAAALLPQRLVIFLDDLDRCRPEQVVDILEAINFLSSAAPCFILVGADYRKVETLAGQHFEAVALQEAQNVAQDTAPNGAGPNTVVARMEYARNYMLKIVNMRLDLPRPAPQGIANLIRQPGQTAGASGAFWQRLTMGLLVAGSVALAISLAVQPIKLPESTPAVDETAVSTNAAPSGTTGAATADGSGAGTGAPAQGGAPAATQTAESAGQPTVIDRNTVGASWTLWLDVLLPLLVALAVLIRLRSAPKEMEKAVDSRAFSEALDKAAPAIQDRCVTPREVRRFQNYLRFLAAWDDSLERPAIADLEAHLVDLAACGYRTPDGRWREDIPPEAIDFFTKQCHMLGLDPDTFRPADERVAGHGEMHAPVNTFAPSASGG